jgi:hypothetical protein
MPGRIELSEPAGTLEVLPITSGAGVAAIEEPVEWLTGAAILSACKTLGRREVTTGEFLSGLAATELDAAPAGTDPDF